MTEKIAGLGDIVNKVCVFLMGLALFISMTAINAGGQTVKISEPEEITSSSVPGQQINPASIVYDGLLYLFWASNTAVGGSGDFDILYSTYDGHAWTSQQVLTMDDSGNDHTPQPVVFEEKLYLFWSSDDAGTTSGSNADIVVSSYDGSSWTKPVSLTSGFGSLGDYNPCPIIFNDQLYVFFEWYSVHNNAYEIAYTHLEATWGVPIPITNTSNGHNLNPTAAVTGQSLILAWESYDSGLAVNTTSSIVSRTLTNNVWSGYISLSGNVGPANSDPFAVTYSGSTWVFWTTSSEAISDGEDLDIVGRELTNGVWSDTILEIANMSDSGDDTGIIAALHDGKMILSWVSASSEYSDGPDTDIIMVIYDGEEWSQPIDISQDGECDDGGGISFKSPTLASHENSLIIIWETNTSPDITVTRNTWLVLVECSFPTEDGPNDFLLAITLMIALALILVAVAKKGRKA